MHIHVSTILKPSRIESLYGYCLKYESEKKKKKTLKPPQDIETKSPIVANQLQILYRAIFEKL